MEVHRFEAIAYAQAAKGVRFLKGHFVDRFENAPPGVKENFSRLYTYKVPIGLEVKKDDLVIVQVLLTHYGILKVTEVFEEPPSIEDYDYSRPMKWVVQVVDVHLSDELTEMDRDVLRSLSRAALQSRIVELSKNSGVDLKSIPMKGVGVEDPKLAD